MRFAWEHGCAPEVRAPRFRHFERANERRGPYERRSNSGATRTIRISPGQRPYATGEQQANELSGFIVVLGGGTFTDFWC
jgi:hypothetical protein